MVWGDWYPTTPSFYTIGFTPIAIDLFEEKKNEHMLQGFFLEEYPMSLWSLKVVSSPNFLSKWVLQRRIGIIINTKDLVLICEKFIFLFLLSIVCFSTLGTSVTLVPFVGKKHTIIYQVITFYQWRPWCNAKNIGTITMPWVDQILDLYVFCFT